MSSQDNDQDTRVVAVVLIGAILLAVGLAVGMGISKARGGAGSGEATTVAAVSDAAPAADAASASTASEAAPAAAPAPAMSAEDASVVIENGVVKFYFASGKADLASGALDALGDAIAAAKGGKRLVLSGFHDATGNPAQNAELAKQRAMAVRDALVGAGVSASALELKKPEQTTGTGNDAEARRVEVLIAD